MQHTAVVILAAGSGTRVGAAVNKVLLPVDGVAAVARSVRTALATPGVRRVVVVVRDGEDAAVRGALADAAIEDARVGLVLGGDTRHASEWRALSALAGDIARDDIEIVAIHDAARPWADVGLFASVIDAARTTGGAIPVIDLDCVVAKDGAELPGRLVGVQTPQAFRASPLLAAYAAAERDAFVGTDTSACLERYADQLEIAAVPGDEDNRKITFPGDLPAPPSAADR